MYVDDRRTHNSPWKCICLTYGCCVKSIHNMLCRTEAILANHNSVSRVGQVSGDIRPVFMLPSSHDSFLSLVKNVQKNFPEISPLGLLAYIWPCHFHRLTCNPHTAAFFILLECVHLSYFLILLIHPNAVVGTTQTQVFTMSKSVAPSIITRIIASIHHPPIHPFAVTNYPALKYTMGKRHQLKIKFLTRFNDFPSPNYSCILNMHTMLIS